MTPYQCLQERANLAAGFQLPGAKGSESKSAKQITDSEEITYSLLRACVVPAFKKLSFTIAGRWRHTLNTSTQESEAVCSTKASSRTGLKATKKILVYAKNNYYYLKKDI